MDRLPGDVRSSARPQYKFFKRLLDFKQMDFEMALYQMAYLCISPRKVYRSFVYHKNTKNQWARDDPAFVVLLALFLALSSILCALVFGLSFGKLISLSFWIIFVDFISVGLIIAGVLWFVCNKFLKAPKMQQYVDQNVEFGYAFDVHCNAFFPLLLILHVLQIVLIKVLADTLWLIALSYYIYITFLGYSALPFLQNTAVLLWPLAGVIVIYVFSVLFAWNVSMSVFRYYGFHHTYPPINAT